MDVYLNRKLKVLRVNDNELKDFPFGCPPTMTGSTLTMQDYVRVLQYVKTKQPGEAQLGISFIENLQELDVSGIQHHPLQVKSLEKRYTTRKPRSVKADSTRQ